MLTAIDYLTQKVGKLVLIHVDMTIILMIGFRNYVENGINYDEFCGGYHRAFDLCNNPSNDIPAVTSGTVITSETLWQFWWNNRN